MQPATDIYVEYICYDLDIPEPKVHRSHVLKAIEIAIVKARLDERAIIIYVLESDLLDNKGVYPKDYVKAIKDEIKNHKMVISDHKAELKKLLKQPPCR